MDFATLEMSGAHRSFRHRITDEDIDQTNFNTYYDYFGFGFKFNEYFAGSFSVSPLAAKGYSISVADSSDDFGVYEYRSIGKGGYDKFTFDSLHNRSNGFRLEQMPNTFSERSTKATKRLSLIRISYR